MATETRLHLDKSLYEPSSGPAMADYGELEIAIDSEPNRALPSTTRLPPRNKVRSPFGALRGEARRGAVRRGGPRRQAPRRQAPRRRREGRGPRRHACPVRPRSRTAPSHGPGVPAGNLAVPVIRGASPRHAPVARRCCCCGPDQGRDSGRSRRAAQRLTADSDLAGVSPALARCYHGLHRHRQRQRSETGCAAQPRARPSLRGLRGHGTGPGRETRRLAARCNSLVMSTTVANGRAGAVGAVGPAGQPEDGVPSSETWPRPQTPSDRPSPLDVALPPVDAELAPLPPPGRDAYIALLVTLAFEATVPSLQCYWGVLMVLWGSPGPAPAASTAVNAVNAANAVSAVTASTITPAYIASSLLDLRNAGLLWTPVLFSASWSVAEPWSETLSAVHGHPRLCSLVGSVLVAVGLLLTALGALLSPRSPLLPLLAGLSAGIASGVGASLVSRSARLVLGQRWGARASLTLGARRLLRALGLTMAPLVALPLGERLGVGGALLVAAVACLPALLAPLGLAMPRKPAPGAPAVTVPNKYERLKEMGWKLTPAHQDADGDNKTEISDDGGSIGESDAQPGSLPPPSNPTPGAAKEAEATAKAATADRTTVVAEVHCDGSGRRQDHSNAAATPATTATPVRVDVEADVGAAGQAKQAHSQAPSALAAEGPQPLYGEVGQAWNIAYSFDCDGDDDIELFVRRQSKKRGALARFCSGLGAYSRGCRADLRPLLRPAFHVSLLTLACCRLAALALPVLLPALAVRQLGPRAKVHLMAALPAVAGIGGMLFGLTVLWEVSGSGESSATSADADTGRPSRSRRRLLSVVSAVAAAGFLLLGWGRSQWWLMLGSLSAGYGAAGTTWAKRFAFADAMGGATSYRAQPLLCVLAGLATVLAPAVCDLELTTCMAILAAMHTAVSVLWLLQPHVARFC